MILRIVASAAALAAAAPALAQGLPPIPNGADVATVGAGSFQTGDSGHGKALIGVNVGATNHRDGKLLTLNAAEPGPAAAELIVNALPNAALQLLPSQPLPTVALNGTPIPSGGWSGLPGLPRLPFSLPRVGR